MAGGSVAGGDVSMIFAVILRGGRGLVAVGAVEVSLVSCTTSCSLFALLQRYTGCGRMPVEYNAKGADKLAGSCTCLGLW